MKPTDFYPGFWDEFDIPRKGWPGRRWAIAKAIWRTLVELTVLLLLVAAFLGVTVLVWAAR
jgi:hypothetical protein